MNWRKISPSIIRLIAVSLLTGCGLFAAPPVVEEIVADPNTTDIETGATVTLRINAQGTGIEFEWTVDRGQLSNYSNSAVVYTAPTSPGPDLVTVKVKTEGGEVAKNISFEVIAPPTPPATETPLPADTPTATSPATPTAAPDPIACHHPSVTKNLFPQLEDVDGQFPMYGPEGDANILCQAVYDIVHTPGKMAVHFKYENVGTNFGWWGIAIKDPDSYDASQHTQLCFWVYAEQPNQAFRVKMKDKTKKEAGDVVTTELTGQWDEICTSISDFADAGIQVDRMDNVNLGFEQPSGSAEIWIADFEFK